MDGKKHDHYVGPPRLINYMCDVTSADTKIPHCVLTMELEDKKYHQTVDSRTVKLQLKASTLDTLLGSFDKIKQQLSSFNEKT